MKETINTPEFKSEINWSKWNPDTPNHPELISEYNEIEKRTKTNDTWMKNEDGTTFDGTPEQFIQQQSSWFKRSFPNPIRNKDGYIQYNYHGIPNKLENDSFTINEKLGELGVGIYTTNNKNYAKGFSKSYNGKQADENISPHLYELYQNTNNAQPYYKEYEEFVKKQISKFKKETKFLPNFLPAYKRKKKELDDRLTAKHVEMFEKGQFKLMEGYDSFTKKHQTVVPFSNYPKSAIGNVGFFDMTDPNIYK